VSGESAAAPGAFLTGANSSSRLTSSSATRSAQGNVSKMNSSSFMPCGRPSYLRHHHHHHQQLQPPHLCGRSSCQRHHRQQQPQPPHKPRLADSWAHSRIPSREIKLLQSTGASFRRRKSAALCCRYKCSWERHLRRQTFGLPHLGFYGSATTPWCLLHAGHPACQHQCPETNHPAMAASILLESGVQMDPWRAPALGHPWRVSSCARCDSSPPRAAAAQLPAGNRG
jgi:hypothetical protein